MNLSVCRKNLFISRRNGGLYSYSAPTLFFRRMYSMTAIYRKKASCVLFSHDGSKMHVTIRCKAPQHRRNNPRRGPPDTYVRHVDVLCNNPLWDPLFRFRGRTRFRERRLFVRGRSLSPRYYESLVMETARVLVENWPTASEANSRPPSPPFPL